MKSIFAAAGLALAIAPMSAAFAEEATPAAATEAAPEATIVVTAKHQKAWAKGSALEAKGLKGLEKARKDLIRYSADVVTAENTRDSSRARGENAAADFRRLTASPADFNDAGEAANWAKKVDEAASEWARFDDRGGDGHDKLAKAMKKQQKAQAKVTAAQRKVDEGRVMKAEAERMSVLASRD